MVHDFSFDEQADGVNKYRLVVSKYSFLKLSTLFNPCVNKSEAAKLFSDRELLLHFQDFDTMGQIEDAEIIRLSDISHAKDPEIHPSSAADTVEHIPQSPDGMSYPINFFVFCFSRTNNIIRCLHVQFFLSLRHLRQP